MKKLNLLFGITLSILVLSKDSFAQTRTSINRDSLLGQLNTITTAVPFLLIAPDARAGGMGDNGVATSADPASIHWNASKLATADKEVGFSISYTPWLRALVDDINLAYLSGYRKLKNNQAIGISLLYFSLGNIQFTDQFGNPNGSFNPNEFAFNIAYARKLGEKLSGGLTLKYIYSNLTGNAFAEGSVATRAGRSVAADLSMLYKTEVKVGGKKAVYSAGMNISNLGAKISYTETGVRDFIPANFRLGNSLKFELDQYNTITISADINKLLVPTQPIYYQRADGTGDSTDVDGNRVVLLGKDPTTVGVPEAVFSSWSDAPAGFKEELREIIWNVATEYWYDNQFAVRAGFFHESATKGNRQFFTLGAGLKYNVFGLDFAYLIPTTQRNPLENTLRFTLTFDFDGLKKDNKENE
ncbi:MAG: hypothetical protein RIQ89_2199 [Bacteroidota bacterium]|jgi:hypothetical protein